MSHLLSEVVIVEAPGEEASQLLQHARDTLPGVSVRLLPHGRQAVPADRLRSFLDPATRWILPLPPGGKIIIGRSFQLPSKPAAYSALHLSTDGEVGRWAPIVVPAEALLIEIDEAGNPVVDAAVSPDRCLADFFVIDPARLARRPSVLRLRLQQAQRGFEASSSPVHAASIGDCLIELGNVQQAETWYRRCVDDGEGDARWRGLYGIARCLVAQGSAWPSVEASLSEAFDSDPNRAEPLCDLAAHLEAQGDRERAFQLAEIGLQIPLPHTQNVFRRSVYAWELALVYMRCAVELGKDAECIRAGNLALRNRRIPESVRQEIAEVRARSVSQVHPYYPMCLSHHNPMVVVCAFRNAGEYLARCVASLRTQDHPDFRVVLIDDASTDGAADTLGLEDPRFVLLRRETRMGALYNQIDAIRHHCEDDDIVVYVDGDDWLCADDALSYIDRYFSSTRCWLMYGQYRNSRGRYGGCEPVSRRQGDVLDELEGMRFPTHIRAHRAGLLLRLQELDPDFSRLRGEQGRFLDSIADMAMMRTLMQLAGLENIRYSERILYTYNAGNPESHFRDAERAQIQTAESAQLYDKPPLRPLPDYQAQRSTPATGAALTGPARVVLLCLDGMTPRLVHQWAQEGHLPNLARLRASGTTHAIEPPAGFGNDAFWNSFCTGSPPDGHGYYYRNVWRPDRYALDRFDIDRELGAVPFWARWADEDLELAIIDIPEVSHAGRVNGIEVTEWVTHAQLAPPRFAPVELGEDWIRRFGLDPTGGRTETRTPRSRKRFERDFGRLLESIEIKTEAALHYLGRGGWDLFALAYTQGHDAGHQFWHMHDAASPGHDADWHRHYGDPLLTTYQAIDRGIGRILARAGDAARVIVVTALSMEAKASCNPILDDCLWAMECASGQPTAGERTDRRARRYFALPHNNLSGAIRLNLAGREASGMVEPGEDYDRTLDEIESGLRQVVNADTGEPVVAEFIRTGQRYDGPELHRLPDLFAIWNRNDPIRRVRTPWSGDIVEIRPRGITDTRSGDHVGVAELLTTTDLPGIAGDQAAVPVHELADILYRALHVGRGDREPPSANSAPGSDGSDSRSSGSTGLLAQRGTASGRRSTG